MTVIECCIDREGNTGLRDLYYICPACKTKYDDFTEARGCLMECAIEEWGEIKEVIEDIEPRED